VLLTLAVLLFRGLCSRVKPTAPTRALRFLLSLLRSPRTARPVSSTLYIPAGSEIIDFNVDVLTAFNSATSATLSIGLTAGGTEYVSSVNVKAATGRIAPTYTAAQLAAMNGVTTTGTAAPTTAPVVVTVTPVGATSAGYVVVTVIYAQQ